jgi:hypothetical protein
MAITFSYTVTGARVGTQDDLADVVKELDVVVKGVDGTATFELPATVKFDAADPDDFTDFADLTEAQLVSWVEADSSLDNVRAHVAYVVAKELEKLALTPKPLPWAPEPVAPEPTAPEPAPATN